MSAGGYIRGDGPGVTVTIRRLADCPNGHELFSVDGGRAEHIISAAEAKAGDLSKLRCQDELDRPGATKQPRT